MTVREFPALGFDPAPGDPAALESAAAAVRGAGDVFGAAGAGVARLDGSGWTGAAGDAYRGQLADLPRDLDVAARAHGSTARALAGYATGLAGRQRRAADLESRAAALRQQEAAAVAEVSRLAASTAPAGSAELSTLRGRYETARSHATTLGSSLQEVLAEARRLHTDHRTAAAEAARAIRAATDAPYSEPGWLSKAWTATKGWIAAHAETLASISAILKSLSAVLGVLSFVPGLQFLAPVALGLATTALLLDAALCLAGKGDWTTLALDAALTILPTGPVVRAFRRLPGIARALDGAGDALSSSRLADRLPSLRRIPRSPLEEAGTPLPRLPESALTRDADGLITHIVGTDVRTYLRTTSTERATRTRDVLRRSNLPSKDSPAYALALDRRTGRLQESANDITDQMRLHDPLIQRRIADLDAADAPGRPFRYSDDPGDVGSWVHPSVPGVHAEVFSTSSALNYRRGARLPVSDDILGSGEIVVDVQNIKKTVPKPFGCCANCSRILRGVPSASGRFATFPHGGALTDVWMGP